MTWAKSFLLISLPNGDCIDDQGVQVCHDEGVASFRDDTLR